MSADDAAVKERQRTRLRWAHSRARPAQHEVTSMKAQLAIATTPALGRLHSVRSSLRARFLERDQVIDLLLAAVIARLHVFLLGPPGTKTFCTSSPIA